MPLDNPAMPLPDNTVAAAERRLAQARQIRDRRRHARAVRLRRIGEAAAAGLHELVRAAAALGGAGLVAYGAWLAWPPAGFLVGGALLIAGVWLHDRNA